MGPCHDHVDLIGVFDISISNVDCRYMDTFENIDIDIDMTILENIDKAVLENIDIDKDNGAIF